VAYSSAIKEHSFTTMYKILSHCLQTQAQ